MTAKKLLLGVLMNLLLVKGVYAHCPLCTVGAAAAAGGAAYLGVNEVVVGLFTGAFAVSIGWWISRLIKKKHVPFQRALIILFSFLTTVLPLLAIEKGFYPFYISLFGEYGSLFNRTYLMNLFLIGSIFGGLIVTITPTLSSMISNARNGRMIPYQGAILTFTLLIISGVIIQLLM